jgi:hypothetical protein
MLLECYQNAGLVKGLAYSRVHSCAWHTPVSCIPLRLAYSRVMHSCAWHTPVSCIPLRLAYSRVMHSCAWHHFCVMHSCAWHHSRVMHSSALGITPVSYNRLLRLASLPSHACLCAILYLECRQGFCPKCCQSFVACMPCVEIARVVLHVCLWSCIRIC